MKMQSLKLFVATMVICLFAVGSAFAQSNLSFNIPFDFQVGKSKLDAGKYEVKWLDSSKFILKNVETESSSIVVTSGQAGTDISTKTEQIVFNRYGDKYFLRQIFAKQGTTGRELGETKYEKNVRKNLYTAEPNLAKNRAKVEQVTVNSTQK
jgi:hypothetical protein